jgi:hypothetical protein
MNRKDRWIIIDWANNLVNTGGATFDSFEDGWGWIYEHVPDEDNAYDDYFVVPESERPGLKRYLDPHDPRASEVAP